jgi:DNA-binding CsgD family transcriptional regulator
VLGEALRLNADRRKGGGRALPLAVLAELRLRQGRDEEAVRLLAGLEEQREALPALVELNVRRGDLALARAYLDQAERAEHEPGRLLVLRGGVEIAAGEPEAASATATALMETAETSGREDLAGEAALLQGRLGSDSGSLEEALGIFSRLGYPLEEGRARLALARARATEGSPLALPCARAARDGFERLGARRDADEAAALLRELGSAGRTTVRGERDELTPREREVLALVAGGLSNGEIAERLVIAPKTAEHHVGNVLAKLGVRSRAEAAALAVREGI